MIAWLVVSGLVLVATSGVPGLVLHRRPRVAQAVSSALLVLGAAIVVAGALAALAAERPPALSIPWAAPGGRFTLRIDRLSAVFLLPILAGPALASVYGLAYYPQARHALRAARLQLLLGLCAAGMGLLVVAANAILFLVAWELMALAGFLMVLTEHERPEAQRAAWVYLGATHVGTLTLFALFSVLEAASGSFDFERMVGLPAGGGSATAAFALALLGFGIKAGLMPFHFWLPGAHAAAPSHVSAVLSGVLLKTGIYGLLRVTGLFDAPPVAWGAALLVLGGLSGVLGVAFALAQHDLKRLLAYHSVENVGIIALGIGLALVGRSVGDPALLVLGFAGGVLHVVNHALFKSLLFLGAGAVIHATGTREVDHLGGLARAMPWTAALFLVGAVAISGLPPLNGFASEWLLYVGSLGSLLDGAAPGRPVLAVLVAPTLALIGGLAAACFAKVYGVAFLGVGRSPHARGHEPPAAMLVPMALLAAACLAIGLFPALVLPALHGAAADWARLPAVPAGPAAAAIRAAGAISLAAFALLGAVAGLALLRWRRLPGPQPVAETWGCGYSGPTPRMQYTGSSFAAPLVARLGWALFPRERVLPPRGLFPARSAFESSVPDPVLDAVIAPALARAGRAAGLARSPLLGKVQFQALLIGLGLLSLLAWLGLR